MITLYTKDYCPYCHEAKNLLDSLQLEYKEIEISDKPEVFAEIKEKSGMNTVPQIFFNDRCLGGFSELDTLNKQGLLLDALK
ncbi:glutaredoxin [Candidatus Peregrinibacteria bacterium]|nr:MAG: glutaredoxin [Candidatus Peregrinibacteria bacterium]